MSSTTDLLLTAALLQDSNSDRAANLFLTAAMLHDSDSDTSDNTSEALLTAALLQKEDWGNESDHSDDDDTEDNVAMLAREGRTRDLINYIHRGRSIDVEDSRGWRPLHEAVYHNHVACVDILLNHEPYDVNWRTQDGETPLIMAAKAGNLALMDILLKAGADPNLSTYTKRSTALHVAASANKDLCVNLLLQSGASINSKSKTGSTALSLAAASGHETVMDSLLRLGAKLYVTGHCGSNALAFAAKGGHYLCLQKLIAASRAKDMLHLLDTPATKDGETALHLSAKGGHSDCVRLLLDNGASANVMTTNEEPSLPLCAAIDGSHLQCVEMLVSADVTDHSLLDSCIPHPIILALNCDDITRIIESLIHNNITHMTVTDEQISSPLGDSGLLVCMNDYFISPFNYKNRRVHITGLLTFYEQCLDPQKYFNASDFLPACSESVPSLLSLMDPIHNITEYLLHEKLPLQAFYRDNIVGNVVVLQALYYLVINCCSFHGNRRDMDLIYDMYLEDIPPFAYLLFGGADVNSCFNITDDISKYSLVDIVNDRYRDGCLTLFDWIRHIILPYCGFVHFNETWLTHFTQEEWTKIKQLEADTQTLTSLCRRRIIFQLLKVQRIDNVKDLDIPTHMQKYLLAESAFNAFTGDFVPPVGNRLM